MHLFTLVWCQIGWTRLSWGNALRTLMWQKNTQVNSHNTHAHTDIQLPAERRARMHVTHATHTTKSTTSRNSTAQQQLNSSSTAAQQQLNSSSTMMGRKTHYAHRVRKARCAPAQGRQRCGASVKTKRKRRLSCQLSNSTALQMNNTSTQACQHAHAFAVHLAHVNPHKSTGRTNQTGRQVDRQAVHVTVCVRHENIIGAHGTQSLPEPVQTM